MKELKKEVFDNTVVFHLTGKLDGVSSPQVQEQISQTLTTHIKNVVLDCTNLEYMSSAGIRVLLQSYHQVGQQSGKIALTSVPKAIEQTLYVTGFLSYFKIFNSPQEAIQYLNEKED